MMIFPQITAKSCNLLQKAAIRRKRIHRKTPKFDAKRRNSLQNATKRCNLPQFAPKRCKTPQFDAKRRNSSQNAAKRRKTPQFAAKRQKNPQIDAIHRKLTQFAAICHNSP
jgi:hypothetical protein